MTNKIWSGVVIVATVLTTAGVGLHHYALAQNDVQTTPPDAGAAPPPQAAGRARRGGGGGGGAATMTVSGSNLYILRGNTLYRLDGSSLEVQAKADLPAVAMPALGGRRGGLRVRPTTPPPTDDAQPAPASS